MCNCWKPRRNLFHLGCCQCSDNQSMLSHEEGKLSSCYSSLNNYSMVYSILTNFEDMRKQLAQQSFSVISVVPGNYGHCSISHQFEFPNLFPMMGIFYMAKVALHCAGKYFKGSSIDIALILTNALEAILVHQSYLEAIMCVPYLECK